MPASPIRRHPRPQRFAALLRAAQWVVALTLAFGYLAAARGQGPAFPTFPAYGRDGGLRIAQQPDPAADILQQPSEPAATDEAAAREERQATVLKVIASNQDAAKKRFEELQKEKTDWEVKLSQLAANGLDDPRPYSYLSLDRARDELAAERQSSATLRDGVDVAKDAVTQASTEKENKQRDVRRAKEALEKNTDAAAAAPLSATLADAEHALKVAQEQLGLRRAELANVQLDQQVQSLRQAHAEKKVEFYAEDVIFTPVMRDEVLTYLDRRINAAGNRLKSLESDLTKYLQPQWYQARQRLDAARVSQDQAQLAALEAEVQAKNLAQQAAQFESEILVDKNERLQDLKQTWLRRFQLANDALSMLGPAESADEAQAALDKLRVTTASVNDRIESVRRQLSSLEKKRQAVDETDAGVRPWLAVSSQVLEDQRRFCERTLAELDAARLVHRKLHDDLTTGTLSDTAGRWLAEGLESIRNIWDYPLATVGESDVTIGLIVKGAILLLAGVYASRLLSRWFGRRLLSRMGFNAGAAAAMQSVAFYLLVLIFTLFALKLVQVPLTAFTVLGGALALGVGFGSQNIVNNFISGLILLAERPVKVGDLIQLADLYGNVEHIGPRSTRIRTGENLDIIVPNSAFLETNVINWTLSDNHMRTKVLFGVAYGSSTGKVTQLALKAAANHDRVFDRPAPFVLFGDFGDNALAFELHFWVAVRTLMERRQIESDIRFNIDHLFREAGITIAFPQRDVHLITPEPIRVQMTPPAERSATPREGRGVTS
jgi:small-conductance mechanosensitive channel